MIDTIGYIQVTLVNCAFDRNQKVVQERDKRALFRCNSSIRSKVTLSCSLQSNSESRIDRHFKSDGLQTPVPGTHEYVLYVRSLYDVLCKSEEIETLWMLIRREAQIIANEEPALASFVHASVLSQSSLADSVAFVIAGKLRDPSTPSSTLFELAREAFFSCSNSSHNHLYFRSKSSDEVQLKGHVEDLCGEHAMQQDLLAVMQRDPACTRFIDALLFFKGFHALCAYRISHYLWAQQNRKQLARYIHSRSTRKLHVDIHPAAQVGPGAFIDHATGVVIGETAVVAKNVSMLHRVTLGGAGNFTGQPRHPTVESGVTLGAGSTLLGPIRIGQNAQIGACSLVVTDVPNNSTAVGVPAKIIPPRKLQNS
uniref:serine O-acetyltransferase n=1 Tax=Timspurckia oligopyrenoides TaxID=708627 RepID=A0A7S0ZK08_9RHOD